MNHPSRAGDSPEVFRKICYRAGDGLPARPCPIARSEVADQEQRREDAQERGHDRHGVAVESSGSLERHDLYTLALYHLEGGPQPFKRRTTKLGPSIAGS
jgi:hypothetical protein